MIQTIESKLPFISTPWLVSGQNDVCSKAKKTFKVPVYCKKDVKFLNDLRTAFSVCDALRGESVTMRSFSSQCCHDSKYFERVVRDVFLRIAKKYSLELFEVCEHESLGIWDKPPFLDIYSRPEIYELSGDFKLITSKGAVDVKVLAPFGIALPNTAVDYIIESDTTNIRRIIFIENKKYYDDICCLKCLLMSLLFTAEGSSALKTESLFRLFQAKSPMIYRCISGKIFGRLSDVFSFTAVDPCDRADENVGK